MPLGLINQKLNCMLMSFLSTTHRLGHYFLFSLPPKCQLLHIYTSGEKLTTHTFRAFLKVITLILESLDLPDLITSRSRVIIFEQFVYEGDVF